MQKYARVDLFYRDGTHEQVISDATANCKGSIPVHIGGSFGRKPLIGELVGKENRSMHAWVGDAFVECALTEENSRTLMYSARCLLQ